MRRIGVLLCALALTAGAQGAEIELRHINDLFSTSPTEDDLYTATIGLAGIVGRWTFDFEELLFTDRDAGLRFDETYVTMAYDIAPRRSKYRARARVGVVSVGKGLFGANMQNYVHRLIGQEEVDLTYVTGTRTRLFFNVQASRSVLQRGRFTLTPEVELQTAGFKRHGRVALVSAWDLGRSTFFSAQAGWRWSRTSYEPLKPWTEDEEPTVALTLNYGKYLMLRWSHNYFGTADRHWHLVGRIPLPGRKDQGTTD